MSPKTVLIAEDDTTVRDLLAESLSGEGYRVLTAADGAQALVQVRDERPDVVLLDLMLPEVSGIDVCRLVRRDSQVPILILTARDAEVDKVACLEVGADDYVTKPFSLRELHARVRALLRRSPAVPVAPAQVSTARPAGSGPALAAAAPWVDMGSVRVDMAGHRIIRDGQAVQVTPKVFALLACLMRHAGQVLSREQLLQDAWGYDYLGDSRTVDVHVRWLRQAIEDDPARPRLLQTVRGAGYVFRPPVRGAATAPNGR